MQHANRVFELLAPLLSYPETANLKQAASLRELLDAFPEQAAGIEAFVAFLEKTPLSAIEELFTRTFDLNPTCCLEVGWHLYGEDYKRGEFLVNMRQALEEVQVSESVELPDHMSHCLRLLATLDFEDGQAFSRRFLLPALEKILQSLDEKNPYHHLLVFLKKVLQQHFEVTADAYMLAKGHGNNGKQLPVVQSW